jgi:hypothetical protein
MKLTIYYIDGRTHTRDCYYREIAELHGDKMMEFRDVLFITYDK